MASRGEASRLSARVSRLPVSLSRLSMVETARKPPFPWPKRRASRSLLTNLSFFVLKIGFVK